MAECIGIFIGSVVGVLVYLILIPDPQCLLLSELWPATADLESAGADVASGNCDRQLGLGGLVGRWPAAVARGPLAAPPYSSVGLAFILPASISLMMGLGAVITWLAQLPVAERE